MGVVFPQQGHFRRERVGQGDRRLIDPEMLDASELAWLNEYHARVMNVLKPHLDARTRDWLATACKEIT